jgi:hypothetical protein
VPDAELADLFTQGGQRQAAHGKEGGTGGGNDNGLTLARHTELLRQAGLQRITPVWQFGDSRVPVAVKD